MDAHALGQYLREAREARELSLDQAEKTLKIRRWILEGFEQGNFNILEASPVQIRGIIRNYARYIGLDEELVLQFYESALESNTRGRRGKRSTQTAEVVTDNRPAAPARRPSTSTQSAQKATGRRRGPLYYVMLLVLGAAAFSVIGYVTVQMLQTPPESFSGTPVAVGDLLQAASPTMTTTPLPTSTTGRTPTLFPRATQNYAGQPVLVTVELRQRAWVRIMVDGSQSYAGMTTPGVILEAPAQNEVIVSASNAAALLITYNGQPQPLFGARGQAVEITFGRENVSFNIGIAVGPTSDVTAITTEDVVFSTLVAEQTPSASPGFTPTPSDTLAITNTPDIPLTATLTPTTQIVATNTAAPDATVTPLPALGQPTAAPQNTAQNAAAPTSLPNIGQPTQPTQAAQITVVGPTLVGSTSTAAASTDQPTNAVTPTITPTLAISAIVPPRITPANATPTK